MPVVEHMTGEAGVERPVVRVGVLGCGNVGGALVELVDGDGDGIAARSGVRLEITRVAVRNLAKPRVTTLAPDRLTHDAHAVATDPDVDVVVELIGGIEPARSLIVDALKAGKPVVTANKELLANFGAELYAVAEAAGRDLLFEAAVGGGIPLLRALRVSLAGERVRRITGIVNGTTNYVLSRMSEERIGYGEALQEAQSLGYAERDPTADVEGYDASAKAAILASIAFNADIVAGDVYREGIETIAVPDIDFAHRLGYEVKLLAVAERIEGDGDFPTTIDVRVHPTMVPQDHPLAGVRGPFNAVFIEGEAVGELMLYGRGAGGRPTASAVLGDLIDAARSSSRGGPVWFPPRDRVRIRPIDELEAQYYLAIDVLDRPGVLASVASVFGRHDVSIRSMEQVDLGDEARLVFITHRAREADVQATLAGLRDLDAVERIGQLLRVIGPEH
ncbi:MAG: homoserine dehydrogenase [Acidimicrobiaceae bacterium]|nr:homoserine dehydrogenase [Acidimicrobiaceae bacterium]